MGTSKRYPGPRSGLLPDFVDDIAPGAAAPQVPDTAGPKKLILPPAFGAPTALASSALGLSQARGGMSKFARTRDGSAMRRAVSQYVRQGTGGAKGAARRMGAARSTGAQLLGFIGEVERDGPLVALQRVNLGGLAGQSAAAVFIALTEMICPPGGRVDEAISRQAMLDTIADLAEQGVDSFDTLTREQLTEFFLGYVIHTIEARVLADLADKALDRSISAEDALSMQQDLHDFVDGSVRAKLAPLVAGASQIASEDLSDRMERIYEVSFGLISDLVGEIE